MPTWRKPRGSTMRRTQTKGVSTMAALDVTIRLLTLVVSGGAVWVAYQGLQTWKRQLYGQTEFDLARRLMLAVQRVRNQLQQCRYDMAQEAQKDLLSRLFEATRVMDDVAGEAVIQWGAPVEEARKALES